MTRNAFHVFVDQLPDAEVERLAALAKALRDNDRVAIAVLTAPTSATDPDEAEALDELARDPDRGQRVSLEEIKAEFQLP
jgi:cytosine/adenosine deaminase-related metal-dependent hydrolase